MMFLTYLPLTSLIALATALPAEPANFKAPTDNLPHAKEPGAFVLSTGGTISKRDVVKVDVWEDPDKGARHETMFFNEGTCYGFGNGWNDIISSLEVHDGKNCIFYKDYDCPEQGERLYVYGTYIPNLKIYDYDNTISSVRCYS